MRYLNPSLGALVLTAALALSATSEAMAGSGGTPSTNAPYSKIYGPTAGTQPTELIDVSDKVTETSPNLAQLMQSFRQQPVASHAKQQTY